MEIEIDSFEPREVIKILAKKVGVTIHSSGAESFIQVPKRFGEGIIKGIDFLDGVGFTLINGTFKKDLVLSYLNQKQQPVRFNFCDQGEIIHILDTNNFRYKLVPMVGSIAFSKNVDKQMFVFPGGKKISYFTLDLNKEDFYPKIEKDLDTIPEQFANVLRGESINHFLYQADYSLSIAECLNEIENNKHEGIVRRIFLESKALDLMWMQIKQYKDDQKALSMQSVLRKTDIKLIMKARNILVGDLKNPPDIHKLAELSGTNATKLKKGFKRLYDKTINEYLRNERLTQAKILLAEENLSIKEISEAVGYTNKSIFSKRFKEKFGVLPSTFLNRYKSEH